MAKATVVRRRDAETIRTLLDSPEIKKLIADLELSRWTGRPGYPIRAMVGMALVEGYYCLPVWTRAVALVSEHVGLRAEHIGCTPSIDACYRFTAKLSEHQEQLTECLSRVLSSLQEEIPELGQTIAIDGSDLPAYANGQRFLKKGGPERTKYSDPDASWGHRSAISVRKGGGFYGYTIHAAVDTTTGLPLAWEVRTAKDPETPTVPTLLDQLIGQGFTSVHAVLDKGYDGEPTYTACESRGIRPIICLKKTQGVKDGKHKPPTCEHGEWTFAGSDTKRGASKWRCPTSQCTPASKWIKADRLHTLIPRSTDRWGELYRQRGSVEREFGYLKHEWGLLPLRVRRLPRVRLHIDLTILARLGTALAKARGALPLAA